MDPRILSVILGVISNVVTQLSFAPFRSSDKKNPPLRELLRDAILDVSETFEWSGPPRVEEVSLFLSSPEVEAVVRQLFSIRIIESEANGTESIRQEFLSLFAAQFQLKKDQVSNRVNPLFTILVSAVEAALEAAIDMSNLTAHEAKSTFRYRQLLDEISTIQKNLDFLKSKTRLDVPAILDFEKKYRSQIAERHGKITPPNFDSARKLAIDDIYVAPQFTEFAKVEKNSSTDRSDEPFKFQQFLTKIYRAVLLGNPGGGKSTLKDKLCFDLASKYLERPMAGRRLTPIPIILRDYGAEKKAKSCSIIEFIELTANSSYQVQPPFGAFEYLLLNGRVLIIFDGLDELLETNYRQKITADVESFCNLYPAVPILVTSREVGYEQAPLDDKRFDAYRLAPFNEDQVREYVTKWFRSDSDLTSPQQQQKTDAFLKESRIVPDLRSNPLMLALMCNIYRGENYIPQNRPDLYDKCAVMLFERWDKTRGIIIPLPFEAHIRPAMMYLAHWIYTNAGLQSGVEELKLIEKTSEYLLEHQYDDRDEAELAARTFIEFCKGRAWVFTDTGAGLYQFTHRTFLEYFTSFHLVRKHSTPDSLVAALAKRIEKREWDTVAQLSIQLLNKHSEGAGDAILSTLAESAGYTPIPNLEGWNLIQFAARCMHFIVPNPRVRRLIAGICLDRYLNTGKLRSKRSRAQVSDSWHYQEDIMVGALEALLNVNSENQSTIANAAEEWFNNIIHNGSNLEGAIASEILTFLPYALRSQGPPDDASLDRIKYWHDFSDRVYEENYDRICELATTERVVSNIVFWRRGLDIRQLIKWHGLDIAFLKIEYLVFPMMGPPAHQLLNPVLQPRSFSHRSNDDDEENSENIQRDLEQLARLGSILLATPTPWIEDVRENIHPLSSYLFPESDKLKEYALSNRVIFGAFAVIAVGLEASSRNTGNPRAELLRSLERSTALICQYLRNTFAARFEAVDQSVLLSEWSGSAFDREQEDFVNKWTKREIDTVGRILEGGSKSKVKPRTRNRKTSRKK
jgi:hypothetical protein